MNLPDRRERRNIAVFLLFSAVYGVAANICAEGYIQARLLSLGFGTGGIRDYGIAVQAGSIAAYLLFARLCRGPAGMKKINAAASLCMGVFPAVLAGAGKIPSLAALQIVILCAAALHGFLTAARATAEFTIAPQLFARGRYGSVSGKASVIGGVIPVCISLGAGFLLGRESGGVYAFLFGVCGAAFALAALFACLYRLGEAPGETPRRVSPREFARTVTAPRYLKLLLPHLLRGVGMAGMYYIIPAALGNIGLSKREEPFLIVIPVAATIAGSFLFMLLSKKANTGAVTFASALACSLLMPLLVVLTGKAAFLSLYFMFFVCNMITQLSIPTGVLRSTPDSGLSLISSMRMLLTSAANSLFIFVFGLWLDISAPVYIMLVSGAVFALCGWLYKKQFSDRLQ
jgi:hypothetical protein